LNQKRAAEPEFAPLGKLEFLDLSKNSALAKASMPNKIPKDFFENLPSLTSLILQDMKLSGTISAEIGNMTKLNVLRLEDNMLTSSIPSEIGLLTSLTELSLGKNSLTGTVPVEIEKLSQQIELDLDLCPNNFDKGDAVCYCEGLRLNCPS
jgi:Leucine-rich repeat (LRR) protein